MNNRLRYNNSQIPEIYQGVTKWLNHLDKDTKSANIFSALVGFNLYESQLKTHPNWEEEKKQLFLLMNHQKLMEHRSYLDYLKRDLGSSRFFLAKEFGSQKKNELNVFNFDLRIVPENPYSSIIDFLKNQQMANNRAYLTTVLGQINHYWCPFALKDLGKKAEVKSAVARSLEIINQRITLLEKLLFPSPQVSPNLFDNQDSLSSEKTSLKEEEEISLIPSHITINSRVFN